VLKPLGASELADGIDIENLHASSRAYALATTVAWAVHV